MSNFIPNLDKIRNGANFLGDIVRRGFEAVQAKFPVQAQDIAEFFMSRANWNGAGPIPIENVPLQQILDAVTEGGSGALNCIDILRNMVVQYRDDDELYFGPGHVLHRGVFKKQTCNDDGTWVSANAASLTIPAECPSSPGTTSNLEADTWYYVYAKLDVAGEAPEYRISTVMPVICDGAGPEHPSYPKLRFLGSFRTTAAPGAFIRPFWRYHNGRVFWREIKVGPGDKDRLGTYPFQNNSGTFVAEDISTQAPPTADAAFLTTTVDQSSDMWLRTKGDASDPAGYFMDSGTNVGERYGTWLEIPVCVIDPMTDQPMTVAQIDLLGQEEDNHFYVVGYHESLL